MRRAERSSARATSPAGADPAKSVVKKKIDSAAAWREFRELVWVHRRRLSIGLTLMMISRLSGIVLPALSKYVIDDVIGKGRHDLLVPIARRRRCTHTSSRNSRQAAAESIFFLAADFTWSAPAGAVARTEERSARRMLGAPDRRRAMVSSRRTGRRA